jgi:deazaflavin-dependent oxidoreductase (nitroreductase family)
MSDVNDFNAQVIAEFRANDGRVGGPFAGATVLVLTTTGAKSGLERVNPVVARVDGDRIYVFASKAGAPTNPDWFHNLVAHPEVTVELGTERFAARAVVVDRVERDRIYAAQAEEFPNFAEYQESTDRVIPVVLLERA